MPKMRAVKTGRYISPKNCRKKRKRKKSTKKYSTTKKKYSTKKKKYSTKKSKSSSNNIFQMPGLKAPFVSPLIGGMTLPSKSKPMSKKSKTKKRRRNRKVKCSKAK